MFVAQVTTSLLALGVIAWAVPWRDRIRPLCAAEQPSVPASPHRGLPEADPTGSVVEPGVLTLLRRCRPPGVALYAVCVAACAGLLAIRWRALLTVFGPVASARWCLVHSARAQVLCFLPFGQIGGDLYRIAQARRRVGGATRSAAVVAFERIAGLAALIVVAGVGLALSGVIPRSTTALGALAAGCGVLLFLVCRTRIHGLTGRIPMTWAVGPWLRHMGEQLAPLKTCIDDPRRCGAVLLLSVGIHLTTALSYAAVDWALDLRTPAIIYLVAVPAITLAQFLPIHVAGIGVLEGGLWAFLGPWAGRTPAEAMALAAGIRLLGLCWLSVLALSFACSDSSEGFIKSDGPGGTSRVPRPDAEIALASPLAEIVCRAPCLAMEDPWNRSATIDKHEV